MSWRKSSPLGQVRKNQEAENRIARTYSSVWLGQRSLTFHNLNSKWLFDLIFFQAVLLKNTLGTTKWEFMVGILNSGPYLNVQIQCE